MPTVTATMPTDLIDKLVVGRFQILGPDYDDALAVVLFEGDSQQTMVPWDMIRKLKLQVDLTEGSAQDCNCSVCRRTKSGRLKEALA